MNGSLDLAGSLRHGLVVDAAGTDHQIWDFQSFTLKRDAPRVALVAVGMTREEDVGHQTALRAGVVDVCQHLVTSRVAGTRERRMMRGEDQRLAGFRRAELGKPLQRFNEPGLLMLARDLPRDESGILRHTSSELINIS